MPDELRDLLRGRARAVPVPSDDIEDVVRAGRSLKLRRRLYSAGVVVLVAALAWTTVPELASSLRNDNDAPKVTGTPTPRPTPTACMQVEFRATYLPEGWSYVTLDGSPSQPGVPPDQQTPRALGHYAPIADETGAYVEFWEYGDSYTLPPGEEDWAPIRVLGELGKIGKIHEGYAVEFHSGGCDYSMIGFGVSQRELRLIARGLRWQDRCPLPRLAGPDIPIEDGKHFGYIEGITETAIQFDAAAFLTGEEANDAAVASGAIEEGEGVPNDYFIQNEDKSSGALSLSEDARVTIETTQDSVPGPAPADVGYLICVFSSRDPILEGHRRSPYWITVNNGFVTRIEEQYLP